MIISYSQTQVTNLNGETQLDLFTGCKLLFVFELIPFNLKKKKH